MPPRGSAARAADSDTIDSDELCVQRPVLDDAEHSWHMPYLIGESLRQWPFLRQNSLDRPPAGLLLLDPGVTVHHDISCCEPLG
ncbi:hypothetical protein ACFQ61_13470 [Streptomyces sp. NPDC056500]|uniref:hypothetical protein n=1 Tax=Streptomyces sp. NPDC056500 TaxID=3345840 RepID=UPI0036CE44F7